MSPEVRGADFGDDELLRFFESVERLTWTSPGEPPEWVVTEAERFAASPPVPSPEALREQVDQAVAIARGWDHPDDRTQMLHAGIKAFYLLRWMDWVMDHHPHRDRAAAYRVRFTPVFRDPAALV